MDWSSPMPCGVINVATRYCLTGESRNEFGTRWHVVDGARAGAAVELEATVWPHIMVAHGKGMERKGMGWRRALYSPFTCWTWNLISSVINCNRVGIRLNALIGQMFVLSIFRVCVCVFVWLCVCLMGCLCACRRIKLFDFGSAILFVKLVDIRMKCNARLIDFMICLIVLALEHIRGLVSSPFELIRVSFSKSTAGRQLIYKIRVMLLSKWIPSPLST